MGFDRGRVWIQLNIILVFPIRWIDLSCLLLTSGRVPLIPRFGSLIGFFVSVNADVPFRLSSHSSTSNVVGACGIYSIYHFAFLRNHRFTC